MRILQLTPYYAPAYAFGGVVRAVEGLSRALVRRGHQITVLTTDAFSQEMRCDCPLEEIRDGVRVLRVKNLSARLRGRLNISTPRGMQNIARGLLDEVDVLHVHEFRTLENLLVTPFAAKMQRPIVLSPHGTLRLDTGRSGFKKVWDRLLSPAVAQRIDQVIALAEAELAEIELLWPEFGRRRIPTQFSIIPNGIDPAEYQNLPDSILFRSRFRLGTGPVVLFMGRLHPRKGVDVLARAFQKIDLPDARLLIVGPDEGVRAEIEAQADPRIILTGYLDGEDRLAAFSAADLFALPAVGEGFSMAVLEAMAAGLPVILSPGCNFPQAAASGAGLIVESAAAPLKQALEELLHDPAKRREMGEAARRLIAQDFSWDHAAAEVEKVYEALLTRG